MTVLNIVREFFPEVKVVKDATKQIQIEVTSGDENKAAIKNHKECAMAMACKRAFDLDGVVISRSMAYLVKDNAAVRYQLPESVSREIISFDRKGGFAPGKYRMRPPCPTNHIGSVRGRHTGSTFTGKPIRAQHITSGIRRTLSPNQ